MLLQAKPPYHTDLRRSNAGSLAVDSVNSAGSIDNIAVPTPVGTHEVYAFTPVVVGKDLVPAGVRW